MEKNNTKEAGQEMTYLRMQFFCEKVYFIIEIYLLMKYFVKYTRETKKV